MIACNGLPATDEERARVVWSDGSGIAACGSSDPHRPHAFMRQDAATLARRTAATRAFKVRIHNAHHRANGADAPCPHHATYTAETA